MFQLDLSQTRGSNNNSCNLFSGAVNMSIDYVDNFDPNGHRFESYIYRFAFFVISGRSLH